MKKRFISKPLRTQSSASIYRLLSSVVRCVHGCGGASPGPSRHYTNPHPPLKSTGEGAHTQPLDPGSSLASSHLPPSCFREECWFNFGPSERYSLPNFPELIERTIISVFNRLHMSSGSVSQSMKGSITWTFSYHLLDGSFHSNPKWLHVGLWGPATLLGRLCCPSLINWTTTLSIWRSFISWYSFLSMSLLFLN